MRRFTRLLVGAQGVADTPLAARLLGAAALVLATAAVQALLLGRPSIAPFVLFYLAVVISSLLGGSLVGLASVALSSVVANYVFIEPFWEWSTDRSSVLATIFFLVAAGPIALLCGTLKETLLAVWRRELDQARAQAVAQVGSWRLDIRRNELTWSDETHAMLGVPPGTPLTYQTFLAVVHPDDRPIVDARWRGALRGEEYDLEHRVVVAGQVKWVRERAILETDKHGAVCGGFGTIQDVTEQKHAQLALLESEEQFRSMFESAGAAIIQVDLQAGVLVRANARFSRLTGYAPEELEGMSYVELVVPEERAEVLEALARVGREWIEGDYVAARRFRRKDGQTIDVELHGVLLRGPSPRMHATLIAVDVTERNAVARELAAAKLSAERAKAVAEEASRAKDHFIAVLSHELRTPLTPVLAGISLLEKEPLSPGGRHIAEVIQRNVELEARLIDDLLDLTRIARGKIELRFETVELCTVIDRAVEVCRPDIESRRLHFGIDYGPRPYLVRADPGRLQQVFWNLLKNAVKFTPNDGCVGVRCRPERGHVVIQVNDSGIGMEPAAVGTIFEAFAQGAHPREAGYGGLGLGLAISRNLTEMHGGRIEARSEGPGKGSTFQLVLPVLSFGSAASEVAAKRRESATEGSARLRILYVEDHGDTAETMVVLLNVAGYDVTTAGDAATALAKIEEGTFDVLVSDLGLPDRSGLELMREVRARKPRLPAIAVSGYGQEVDVAQSRAAGFRVHLVKPVAPAKLISTIAEVASRAD